MLTKPTAVAMIAYLHRYYGYDKYGWVFDSDIGGARYWRTTTIIHPVHGQWTLSVS
jgi:hypothetical protein